jgi:HTH-type transcriptional regulator, competence development regulator
MSTYVLARQDYRKAGSDAADPHPRLGWMARLHLSRACDIRGLKIARRCFDLALSSHLLFLYTDALTSFLSKVERAQQAPPSEAKTVALAGELDVDVDMLLAMAGKVSSDLQTISRAPPRLFAQLIRELKDMPEHAVLRLVREVRDGDW